MSKRLRDSWSEFAAEADRAADLRGDAHLSVCEVIELAERRGLNVLHRGLPTTAAEVRAMSNQLPVRPMGPLEVRPPCSQCDGSGRVAQDSCARCSATGIGSRYQRIQETETMTDLTAAAAYLAAINEADALDEATDARLDRLHAAAEVSADARWSTITEDLADLAAAEDAEMDAQEQEANRIQEMLAGQTLPAPGVLLYWRASGGQSDLYGGEFAADTDQDAEAESFRLELLAQCATDAERVSIAAGRIEWAAS